MCPRHEPVLLAEVLEALNPQPGQTVVDVTVGAGGHAWAIGQCLAGRGRLIGLDRDAQMLSLAQRRLEPLGDMVTLVHSPFSRLGQVLSELGIGAVDAVLADLGVASDQLDAAERGFSFQQSGPLDMRMDGRQRLRAWEIVNRWDAARLEEVLRTFGQERFGRRIARRIVETRKRQPIETTEQLARVVVSAVGRGSKGRRRIHPATRTFQAIRIAVNDELAELERLLGQLPDVVRPGGVAAVISFHSLEDRLVKQAFTKSPQTWTPLWKGPRVASREEVCRNPRARSAKLRSARRRATDRTAGFSSSEDGTPLQ